MRILLTGAAGFTGQHFTAEAEAAGHKVMKLQADITDAAAVAKEVNYLSPTSVLHLAAKSFVGHAGCNEFYSVNVVGTTNLLDALVKVASNVSNVLLASSANIYGNHNESPIEEAVSPAPVNHYGMSKLAMEYMARNYLVQLPIVITRPFNYTGPGQNTNFVIPKLIQHYANRATSIALGNLHIEREFNDIKMICRAYLQLLEYGESGEVYNICSGRPHTLLNVISVLERISGHHIRIEVDPSLVRAKEVHRLCGSPAKLQALIRSRGTSLIDTSLEETLRRMLTVARADA